MFLKLPNDVFFPYQISSYVKLPFLRKFHVITLKGSETYNSSPFQTKLTEATHTSVMTMMMLDGADE